MQPTCAAGRFLVTLTGEHTGALGAIRAHAKRYPNLSVVQIDAHGDLRHAYQDNLYSHASVMARVVDDGLPLGAGRHPIDLSGRNRADRDAPIGSPRFLPPNCWTRRVRTKGKRPAGFPMS